MRGLSELLLSDIAVGRSLVRATYGSMEEGIRYETPRLNVATNLVREPGPSGRFKKE